ncbi:Acetyl-CoA synthetase-like protein [Mycena sanguinolenta]|uniref:Acetyl-CoA synthetase-like protein n=1 Tax=Mycena sanguinolenta TaxID=230812 RepID=A0A8H6Z662_9AGAR|nr:Acetyl-CoA synthetase-like protein [Mycena sanguinolenta]
MYALCRAGYIPDMLTISVTNPEVISEMLRENDARALLHASNLDLPVDCGIFSLTPVLNFETLESDIDLPSVRVYNATDVAFINHTSGSTTKPKAVVCTNKWFESVYSSWTSVWNPAEEGAPQDVFTLPGSVCQPSGFHTLSVGIHLGGAFIQTSATPRNPSFPVDELVELAREGGLNRMNTFAPLMIPYFMATQAQLKTGDDSILKVLRNMRSIVYGGMPLLPVFEDWAFENQIPLMNSLGTTEAGPLLHSYLGHHPRHMVPFDGIDIEFEPQAKSSADEVQLFALIVLPTSPNIPSKASCGDNGRFYTGDLFSRNEDGTYTHRGRDGDWIKVGNAYLIDTKRIEEQLKTTCSDLIKQHVVVGD